MAEKSSGILVYRMNKDKWEFLLVFPGGPYYSINKDNHKWSIPKGKIENKEEPLDTSIREFQEETGIDLSEQRNIIDPLGEIRYNNGKKVFIYCLQKDLDINEMSSNTFHMEWPKKSGKEKEFPEIKHYEYMNIEKCRKKCHIKQLELIEHLYDKLEK